MYWSRCCLRGRSVLGSYREALLTPLPRCLSANGFCAALSPAARKPMMIERPLKFRWLRFCHEWSIALTNWRRADVATIAKLARHSDISQTEHYLGDTRRGHTRASPTLREGLREARWVMRHPQRITHSPMGWIACGSRTDARPSTLFGGPVAQRQSRGTPNPFCRGFESLLAHRRART